MEEMLSEQLYETQHRISTMIKNKEDDLMRAWIQETGLKPSESVICHKVEDGAFKMWVEKK